jgi:thymidylate kinase
LILDCQTGITVAGLKIAEANALLKGDSPAKDQEPLATSDRLLCLLLHCILDKQSFRDKHRAELSRLAASERSEPSPALVAGLGEELASRLFQLAQDSQHDQLLALKRQIRKALQAHVRTRDNQTAGRISYALDRLRRIIVPNGIMVALCGADGAGKSSAVEALSSELAAFPCGSRKVYMGGNQFILPTGRLLNRSGGKIRRKVEGSSPRKKRSLLVTVARLLGAVHHFIELWLRYLLRARSTLTQGGIVICDRYFYDLALLPGLPFPKLRARLARWFSPRPDITVILTADPEELLRRDPTTSFEESVRQQQILEHIARISGDSVLKPKGNQQDVAHQVLTAVVKSWTSKNRR